MSKASLLKLLALLEILFAILAVALDILIPSVAIVVVGLLFLLLRREGFSSVGLVKPARFAPMVWQVFLLSLIWTVVDYALLLPIANHLSGVARDVSAFAELKGNIGQLLFLLTASWTLAAFVEELAFRGIVQARIQSLIAHPVAGAIVAVAVSSILFGWVHTEQGIAGLVITALDAVFFSIIRRKYKTVWAGVFAHGFMNSIGVITFFFTGPIYGLW